MTEFTFSIVVRVEQDKDTAEEFRSDEYALQFASASVARILALADERPFAENAYSKIRLYSVSLKAGDKETHHEPAAEHQAEAEEPKTMGFSSEEIASATARNTEQP